MTIGRCVAALVLFGVFVVTPLTAQRDNPWNLKAPWVPWDTRGTDPFQRHPPFKIFDDVYYVGLHGVSAYLINTTGGMALLDATYPETANFVLDSVRRLGFQPTDIKYVFVSHAHGDHSGGAARIQKETGARVGMSAEDWDLHERGSPASALKRDLVIKDGDTITLGATVFKFYVSPGHTPGSLTVEYPVCDRGKRYRTLSPGGLGLNFGPQWTAKYIQSVERLKHLGPFEVLLPNHPFMTPGGLFQLSRDLEKPRPAGVHPLAIGPATINAFLDAALKVAREKLAAEQQARP